MNVTGVKEIKAKLEAHKKRVSARFLPALMEGGLFLQGESQSIVPVKTSNLEGSAYTRPEEVTPFRVVVAIGYEASYAVYVHERIELRHKPGKQAKFLEQPLREKRDRMGAIIVEAMKGDALA